MAATHIETSSASSCPFLSAGVGVAACVQIGLIYMLMLDLFITQAPPSLILVGALFVTTCWLIFLFSLRRVITVSPLGVHVADSFRGWLIHERVVYSTPTEQINIELVSKRWYAFVAHRPSGEQSFICFLRATGVAAVELKKALEVARCF